MHPAAGAADKTALNLTIRMITMITIVPCGTIQKTRTRTSSPTSRAMKIDTLTHTGKIASVMVITDTH